MTFVDDDVTAIGVRSGDSELLQDMQIVAPVTVALKAGGAVHALLCRRTYRTEADVRASMGASNRWLVYYDRNADRMVVHQIQAKQLGQWLRRLGV